MRWDIKEWRSRDMPHPQLSSPDPSEGFRGFHIRQAVFLSGGKRLAALTFFGGLRIVDTATGTERFRSEFGDLLVSSADERMLAIAGSEEGSSEIKRIGRGMSLAARAVITHHSRGLILLRDSETGQEKRSIAVRDSQVWAMAFARRQDPRRHVWLGLGADLLLRCRQRQGNSEDQRAPAPLAGPGLHARRQSPCQRDGRRVGARLGPAGQAMSQSGNPDSTPFRRKVHPVAGRAGV